MDQQPQPRAGPPPRLLRLLLDSVAEDDHHVERIVYGPKWILSIVADATGRRRGGLALASASCCTGEEGEQGGATTDATVRESARAKAEDVLSDDPLAIASGLATLNALVAAPSSALVPLDAAQWLAGHVRGQRLAVVGRFPFLDRELRGLAKELRVFELTPRDGEHGEDEIPHLLPQADVVAITSSTLVNHSLDGILAAVRPGAEVMLLGPSTPLSLLLFDLGISVASGVEIVDPDAAVEDVAAGHGFRGVRGLRRVSLVCETAR